LSAVPPARSRPASLANLRRLGGRCVPTGASEFVITIGKEKKEVTGKAGLELLEGKEGAQVSVKCDKDVNVLKVTVKLKK
jgi:hypothetical protein